MDDQNQRLGISLHLQMTPNALKRGILLRSLFFRIRNLALSCIRWCRAGAALLGRLPSWFKNGVIDIFAFPWLPFCSWRSISFFGGEYMYYSFFIPFKDCNYSWVLLPYGNFQIVHVEGFCHFEIEKIHNHCYEIVGYFYLSHHLVRPRRYRSKRELFGTIQELLQKELNDVVQ